MVGTVRQPVDVQALESYLAKHVHEIKRPIQLKQVSFPFRLTSLPQIFN